MRTREVLLTLRGVWLGGIVGLLVAVDVPRLAMIGGLSLRG